MRWKFLIFCAALAVPMQIQAQGTWEDRRVERLAWPELQTFENEREYRAWLRSVDRIQRRIRNRRASVDSNRNGSVAALRSAQGSCPLIFEECQPREEGNEERIIVTGSRIARPTVSTAAPVAVVDGDSITNNQSAGVDEGDFVKRIGDYLLVLQDGRIFAANFRDMTLTDRIDVYRRNGEGEPTGADWYDEMLVQGNNILITAYSYDLEASEISVFRLDQDTGQISRRGVFLISSEDYYDVDNYATRIVGDQLVVYTPYDPRDLADRRGRPSIRRWVSDADFEENRSGRPILNARDIYRPVFGTYDPLVHTLSICDLGELDDDDLDCESTAFIADETAEMYVSPSHIYLATTGSNRRDERPRQVCRAVDLGAELPGNAPGAIFRVPLNGGTPDLLPIRGMPFDQFSMDQFDGNFRAVLHRDPIDCEAYYERDDRIPPSIELIVASDGQFRSDYRDPRERTFADLPYVGTYSHENRFIGDWLLLGSRSRSGYPPIASDGDEVVPDAAVAIRVDDPEQHRRLQLGHEVTRIESLGIDGVITGYRDSSGLFLSYIDLAEEASIADQTQLEGHFESESRSHAFNAALFPERDGLIGLPTVRAASDAGRQPWRSDDSGISFLRFNQSGEFQQLGWVEPSEATDKGNPAYSCEVSCVDWYGNARPIFIDQSVFALMGTEIVQGRALEDGIEIQNRLDLTGAPAGD